MSGPDQERRMRRMIIAAAAGLIALGAPARAQEWPARPITLIVPFAAGGAGVAKAPPDGYTLLIGNSGTHAFNQSLYKKPLYNAVADFEPVGLATESPRIIIARKDLPATTLA